MNGPLLISDPILGFFFWKKIFLKNPHEFLQNGDMLNKYMYALQRSKSIKV